MKLLFSTINFRNQNYHKVSERYDDRNFLLSRTIYDEFGRDTDTKWFDSDGKIIGSMHKEYLENGLVESFKNNSQEYVRKCYTIIKDGFKHSIEEYVSKTSPQKNYINEFVYDFMGNLIKLINNGKEILLK